MDKHYDVSIIGAGVIGCFLARELAKYDIKVLVLEKNNDVGNEASGANSAIIHSGYDPKVGSLKAKLNVLGNKMYDKICKELDVEFKRIGSITCAMSEEEVEKLKELKDKALENNVECVLLSKEEVLAKEKNLSDNIYGGLYAKTAGIINPFTLCVNLMENAIDNGVDVRFNTLVNSIKKIDDYFLINETFKSKIVLNCAGVYADYINELVNPKSFTIIPRKGEYFLLNHFDNNFIKHTLFLLPTLKGKGVLISPTTSYNYLIGPSADECDITDKATDKETLTQIKETAAKMVKNLPLDKTIKVFAGIRPTPDTHDFIIKESETKNFINVAGIESPGIASAPAIAKMVIEDILKFNNLKIKDNYNPIVRKHIVMKNLSEEDKKKVISQDSNYAKIVCKCEQVSKGEILDALNRSCPPRSFKGLRKRLRTGFGLCQSGMCQAELLKIMADFYNCDMKDITYDNPTSYILLKKSKED